MTLSPGRLAGPVLLGGALLLAAPQSATAQCGGAKADCGSAPPPQTRETGRLYFENRCRHAVRVAIRWFDGGGARSAKWWTFQPDERS